MIFWISCFFCSFGFQSYCSFLFHPLVLLFDFCISQFFHLECLHDVTIFNLYDLFIMSWCSRDISTLQSSILVLFYFNKCLILVFSFCNSEFLSSRDLIFLSLLSIWLLKSIKPSSYFFCLSSFSLTSFCKFSISFSLLQTDSFNFIISSESCLYNSL